MGYATSSHDPDQCVQSGRDPHGLLCNCIHKRLSLECAQQFFGCQEIVVFYCVLVCGKTVLYHIKVTRDINIQKGTL